MERVKTSMRDRVAAARVGFSSKHELYNYLQTDNVASNGEKATYNADLLPTPQGECLRRQVDH